MGEAIDEKKEAYNSGWLHHQESGIAEHINS